MPQISEQGYLDQFSTENLIRKATQSTDSLAIPAQYSQPKPDMLGMQTDSLLASMAMPHPAVGNPGVPYAHTNYDGALPIAGKDFGVGDITNWIKSRESNGNYSAINREQQGNTASGAYQYTDGTWNGYGGYAKAALAPKAVQDARFAEDIQARYHKFNGDPYKMIAAHFMPKYANDPRTWTQQLKTGGRTKSVADYVAYVVHGTPLEGKFGDYLARH